MNTYIVNAVIKASKFLGTVQAKNEGKAFEKAWDMAREKSVSVCHHCASEIQETQIHEICLFKEEK